MDLDCCYKEENPGIQEKVPEAAPNTEGIKPMSLYKAWLPLSKDTRNS